MSDPISEKAEVLLQLGLTGDDLLRRSILLLKELAEQVERGDKKHEKRNDG